MEARTPTLIGSFLGEALAFTVDAGLLLLPLGAALLPPLVLLLPQAAVNRKSAERSARLPPRIRLLYDIE
jgi:hypothetical protein